MNFVYSFRFFLKGMNEISLSKILVFFLLLFPLFSQAKTNDFSSKKDSLIKEYYPSGHIKIKGKRYNGIWNGVITEFYDVSKRDSHIYKKTKYKKGVFK